MQPVMEALLQHATLVFEDFGFDAAEGVINRSDLDPESKSAVWIHIWSLQDRRDRFRLADDARNYLAHTHD